MKKNIAAIFVVIMITSCSQAGTYYVNPKEEGRHVFIELPELEKIPGFEIGYASPVVFLSEEGEFIGGYGLYKNVETREAFEYLYGKFNSDDNNSLFLVRTSQKETLEKSPGAKKGFWRRISGSWTKLEDLKTLKKWLKDRVPGK